MQEQPTVRGRLTPAHPTLTLHDSGYTVPVRRVPAGTMASLRVAAAQELAAERPTPPSQLVEIAPDQWEQVAIDDDASYLEAISAWRRRVELTAGVKFAKLIANYALLAPVDLEAVETFTAAMAAAGVPVEGTPEEIWAWSIVAPTEADQQQLMGFVLGLSEAQQEAIQAQKRSFRSVVVREST
jgi:hypothetical protein